MLYHDEESTQLCAHLASEMGLKKLSEKVLVVWNTRMRSAAGRAYYLESRIELNPKLKTISDGEVRRTLLHELAHLVAFTRHGKRIAPHGGEWQQACIDLGIGGERATHKLPLPSIRHTKQWKYTCPSCGEGFERARRMKRAAACYTCCKNKAGGAFSKKYQLVESKAISP